MNQNSSFNFLYTFYRLIFFAWLVFALLAGKASAQDSSEQKIAGGGDRSFFFLDINLSGFYSSQGADLSGTGFSHLQPTDRLPRNYVGVEFIHTFGENSRLRRLFGPLELTTIDLNPHIEVDFNQPSNTGDSKIRLKLVIHDFWFRFEPRGLKRTTLRVGHFDIPYGINPILSPRGGMFVMPPEINDIGLKKDWGIVWKGPVGSYDYELALTTGTGLGLHDPNWFDKQYPGSYIVSARVGAPTYWDFQYGLSALYGKIPRLMADNRLDERAIERWRINADFFYKLKAHTVFMSQIGFGQNDLDTGRSNTLAAHFLVDYIPPWFQLINFKVQVKTVFSDLDQSNSDHTSALFEVAYSLSTPLMVRLDYVHDFRVPEAFKMMGRQADDRLYLTINFYQ